MLYIILVGVAGDMVLGRYGRVINFNNRWWHITAASTITATPLGSKSSPACCFSGCLRQSLCRTLWSNIWQIIIYQRHICCLPNKGSVWLETFRTRHPGRDVSILFWWIFVILQNKHFNRHRFQTLTGNKSNMAFLSFVQKFVFGNIARQSPDRHRKTTISLPGFVLKSSLVN